MTASFTSAGRVEVGLRCAADAQTGQTTVAFAVKDAGLGMAPEQVARIFQPFVQADSSTTRLYGGTGLGLSISKGLAEALGGDIEVESRPGEGSTFTMKMILPGPVRMLNDLSEATVRPSDRPQSSPATVRLHGRVLLAEDGVDNQTLISAILRLAGAEVDVAANGRLAVAGALSARAAGTPYNAILMDMQMPEMDGYEATRQLRQSGYCGPIIALTAHAMAEDRAKCLAAGADEYATKPVDRPGLLLTLARLMDCPLSGPEQAPAAALSAQASAAEAVYSGFVDDPEMAELIEAFVARLPDTLAAMAKALVNNSHEELQRLAHQLKGAGGGYGYPLLTQQAGRLEGAVKAADKETAALALNDLQALARAVFAGRATTQSPKG